MWIEVNNSINYPLERLLIDMVENEEINLDNGLHKFSVSWVAIGVVNAGLKLFVESWNNHPLPSKFLCVKLLEYLFVYNYFVTIIFRECKCRKELT